ncbi:MAG: RidA family protein [Planctomycetaceae bacterium]|nr:RidA family protein [Planctomycetaceae bacterium]
MAHNFHNPQGLCQTFGWTHVVESSGGIDTNGIVVGPCDLKRQTEQAFENIRLALAAVGATFRHVVATRLYVVGLKPEHVPIIREVRSRYVDAAHPPASTSRFSWPMLCPQQFPSGDAP